MNLEEIKQELIDRSVQVAILDTGGILLGSDHSLLDLRSIEGKDVFEEIDVLFGLRDAVDDMMPGDPPLLMPIITFRVGAQEILLNLEIHRRESDLLMVFLNHKRVLGRLRDMQQERNDSMILLEKIREQREELQATNQQLQAANKELDRFAYVVSHDLKSPLRGIQNLAKWIREGMETGELDELGTHVRLIQERSGHMEQLIDAILEYSRAGRRNTPREVDVARMIGEIMAQLDPEKQVRLELPERLPVFTTQATWLYQVFANLLTNSFEYGKAADGGPQVIRIGYQELPDAHQFSVSDQGQGIPKEHQERIFEIFETLGENKRSGHQSTGIGLSIVKKLVQETGGRITVESEPDQGAKFSFTWGKD